MLRSTFFSKKGDTKTLEKGGSIAFCLISSKKSVPFQRHWACLWSAERWLRLPGTGSSHERSALQPSGRGLITTQRKGRMNRWFQTLWFGPKGPRTCRTHNTTLLKKVGSMSGFPIFGVLKKSNLFRTVLVQQSARSAGPNLNEQFVTGPWRRRVAWYRQVRNPCEDAFCSTSEAAIHNHWLARLWNHRRRVSSLRSPNPDQLRTCSKSRRQLPGWSCQ